MTIESTPNAAAASDRETLETLTIVDVDVHVHEDPAQLAEYADPPWDVGLREIAKVEERYLDLPGLSPRAEYRVPFPGGSHRRQIATSYFDTAVACYNLSRKSEAQQYAEKWRHAQGKLVEDPSGAIRRMLTGFIAEVMQRAAIRWGA